MREFGRVERSDFEKPIAQDEGRLRARQEPQYAAKTAQCIEILLKNGKLMMCFQGDHEQLYELEHYHYDVFSWLLTHDEDVRRGRFPVTTANFYLLSFKQPKNRDEIDGVAEVNTSVTSGGEILAKERAAGRLGVQGPSHQWKDGRSSEGHPPVRVHPRLMLDVGK